MNRKKNICLLLIASMLFSVNYGFSAWRFKPIRVDSEDNSVMGDIILSVGSSNKSDVDIIGEMMNCLGLFWDHSMMIINADGSSMTHNYFKMDEKSLEKLVIYHKHYIAAAFKKCGVPYMFDPVRLSNGLPGISTEGIRSKGEFMALLTTRDQKNRKNLEEVAGKMSSFKGYYIFNAYANLQKFRPAGLNEQLSDGKGSHCSGTIWWASKYAGKEMSLFTLDNRDGMISSCAGMMKTFVRDKVRKMVRDKIDEYGTTNEIEDEIFRIYTSENEYDCDDKLANQVVNTFLFNEFTRTDDYWKKHLDGLVIESIAPDHLLMMGMPDRNGNFALDGGMSGRQQQFTSYYDAITDYTESGGYYYKFEDTDDSNKPPVDPRYTNIFNTPCDMGIGVQCCE